MKIQVIDQEKIFPIHISGKELVNGIHKKTQSSTIRQSTMLFKSERKI